jgi:hypothetical protein
MDRDHNISQSLFFIPPMKGLSPPSPLFSSPLPDTSSGQHNSEDSGTDFGRLGAWPPSRCFRRVPGGSLDTSPISFVASTQLLLSLREVPPNRPDLSAIIPNDGDAQRFCEFVTRTVSSLDFRHRLTSSLPQSVLSQLSEDEICAIAGYTIEAPYSLYRWLNGWLMGDRRDEKVIERVGPYFALLYRALEKLPIVTTRACRGVRVRNVPALQSTFQNYEERCKEGSSISFWGIGSFTTKDDVCSNFVGNDHEEGIVYSCGRLQCVKINMFSLVASDEAEVIPLPPAIFTVKNFVKVKRKHVDFHTLQSSA